MSLTFFANTIYYDCKNDIIIDRYGKGVSTAMENKISLPCYSSADWELWRKADFVPGVKLFRFYKFVTRGMNYDVDEARFVQNAIKRYVDKTPEAATQSCYHALVNLGRGETDWIRALSYKEKLKNKVMSIYRHTMETNEKSAKNFWNVTWEPIVTGAMNKGDFETDFNDGLELNNDINMLKFVLTPPPTPRSPRRRKNSDAMLICAPPSPRNAAHRVEFIRRA